MKKFSKWATSLLCASVPVAAQAFWPVGIPDQAEAVAGEALQISVLSNDTGEGLQIVEANSTTTGSGSVSVNADNQSVTYTSAANFEGVDTFWYAFQDSEGRTNAAKVSVTVSAEELVRPNTWPTAGSDSVELTVNKTIEIPVLDNDQGVGLTLTQVNTTTVGLGTAAISADGKKIIYTPALNYTGTDEFWYVFSDNWGRTNAGRVTPVVKQSYAPWPSAVSDNASTKSTASVAIPVLDNDSGEALKIIQVNGTTVAGGKAVIENNHIRYMPAANFSGSDSFWYAFEDAQGRTNSTQVFVEVTENTENSSISFCGTTYKTDGTASNTFSSGDAPDASNQTLDTSVGVSPMPAQIAGNFAVVGDRRYYVVADGSEQVLWVEKDNVSSVVERYTTAEALYAIGIKDDTLFYASYPVLEEDYPSGQPRYAVAPTQALHSHNANTLKTLGRYRVSAGEKLALLDNLSTTYFKYTGHRNIGDGPDVYRDGVGGVGFLRIDETSGLAVNAHFDLFIRGLTITTANMFHYNGHNYASDKGERAIGGGTSNIDYLIRQNYDVLNESSNVVGVIDQAVVSNDRLLMTTTGHTSMASSVPTSHNPMLYTIGVDGQFIELAVCEE